MTKRTKESYVDVNSLYEQEKTLRITISHPSIKGGLPIEIDVELYNKEDKDYDCMIGHFGYNFYFRTNKGMRKGRYEDFPKMFNAIKRTCETRGFKFINYEII